MIIQTCNTCKKQSVKFSKNNYECTIDFCEECIINYDINTDNQSSSEYYEYKEFEDGLK